MDVHDGLIHFVGIIGAGKSTVMFEVARRKNLPFLLEDTTRGGFGGQLERFYRRPDSDTATELQLATFNDLRRRENLAARMPRPLLFERDIRSWFVFNQYFTQIGFELHIPPLTRMVGGRTVIYIRTDPEVAAGRLASRNSIETENPPDLDLLAKLHDQEFEENCTAVIDGDQQLEAIVAECLELPIWPNLTR